MMPRGILLVVGPLVAVLCRASEHVVTFSGFDRPTVGSELSAIISGGDWHKYSWTWERADQSRSKYVPKSQAARTTVKDCGRPEAMALPRGYFTNLYYHSNREGARFLTFLIGGIWHGAGRTFIVWGALHGAALSLCNLWKKLIRFRTPRPIAWLLTLLFVHFAWVYFRAPDVASANVMLASMFGVAGADSLTAFDWSWKASWFKYLVLVSLLITLAGYNSMQIAIHWIKRRGVLKCIICCGCVSALCLFGSLLRMLAENVHQPPFVYFQF